MRKFSEYLRIILRACRHHWFSLIMITLAPHKYKYHFGNSLTALFGEFDGIIQAELCRQTIRAHESLRKNNCLKIW